jgi:trk system potassium uptake protein TrkA
MKVIIGGYGRVGRQLASMLEFEGHTVTVIDKNPLAFEDPDSQKLLGRKIVGMVYDRGVLEDAGIADADCFAAVTAGDNSNIVAARIAKEIFRVPRVVARIYDPRRAEIYQGLGVSTVAAVSWTGARLLDLLSHPELRSVRQFGNGEVELMELEIPAWLDGHLLEELEIPGEIDVVSIVREGRARIPSSGFVFRKNDVLSIGTLRESADKLERLLGTKE